MDLAQAFLAKMRGRTKVKRDGRGWILATEQFRRISPRHRAFTVSS